MSLQNIPQKKARAKLCIPIILVSSHPSLVKHGVSDFMQKHVPFEVFDHTADVGIHAYGETLKDLFVHAAQGMESLMVVLERS